MRSLRCDARDCRYQIKNARPEMAERFFKWWRERRPTAKSLKARAPRNSLIIRAEVSSHKHFPPTRPEKRFSPPISRHQTLVRCPNRNRIDPVVNGKPQRCPKTCYQDVSEGISGSASPSLPGSGKRLANTLSIRFPSRSTTSKRQPCHSVISPVRGTLPINHIIMPLSV